MKLTETLTRYRHHLQQVPRRYWVLGGVVLAALLYSLFFFIPKQIQFSYSEQTCVPQLLLAPTLQSAHSDEFTITPKDELKIGSVTLLSTKLCIQPKQTPAAGTYNAAIAPFGGVIAAKQLRITAPDAPKAQAASLQNATISTVKPLEIPLTAPDIVHTYTLSTNEKEATCEVQGTHLLCKVDTFNLDHNATYTLTLARSLNGGSESVLLNSEVETLSPLTVTQTSVAEGEVVYAQLKQFMVTADREVSSIDATLTQIKDDTPPRTIKIKTSAANTTATIELLEKLPMESKYELTLKQLLGEDGSSLAEPQTIHFTTSGGPSVKALSIGEHSVDRNARILITLDQPLAKTVDVSKFASVKGVNAAITKASDTQIEVSLRAAPDCEAFTITLKQGMQSGVNDELSKEWNYTSRTICGLSSVIGYSVQGRPIVAYYFGSGAETVLFTGGIHGSERSGQQTMQAYVAHLQAYGNTIPANRRVVVVPNTNPDAIAMNTRNNANDVNVDRNFPAPNWKADIETARGILVNGGGTAPGSEPETKALLALTRQLRPRLSVSFHAQGRLVGANQVSISVQAGNIYASTVGYGTMYGIAEEVMGYPITGEYEDWMGEELGVAAILIELPTPSGNYLSSQLAAIQKMLKV